jgi:hypothetical protein
MHHHRCFRCGIRGHKIEDCRIKFQGQMCWLCFNTGHKIDRCPMSVPIAERTCVICLDHSTKFYTQCCSKRICRHCIPQILTSSSFLVCPCCRSLDWLDNKWVCGFQTSNPLIQWRLILATYKP